MNFAPNNFYHIYNRGNGKQQIFFKRDNYLYFLRKIRKGLTPHFDFLAYCLMPNHFHFLAMSKITINNENIIKSLAHLLSSYTQAINKQENKSGTLFQRRTKAKAINQESNYLFNCVNYIHQNPVVAGLVKKIEDWEFSSFRDYIGIRNGTLCNIDYCWKLMGISTKREFFDSSYQNIDAKFIRSFY
jgi:REP element-mobilizing transposase RayT